MLSFAAETAPRDEGYEASEHLRQSRHHLKSPPGADPTHAEPAGVAKPIRELRHTVRDMADVHDLVLQLGDVIRPSQRDDPLPREQLTAEEVQGFTVQTVEMDRAARPHLNQAGRRQLRELMRRRRLLQSEDLRELSK